MELSIPLSKKNESLFRQVYKGLRKAILLRGVPQWEIVEEAAQVIKPARDESIRQSAQGTVVHNDDTSCACSC
jgi:hypothetical protein